MSAVVEYGTLLQREKPEVVHNDEVYRHYLDLLASYLGRNDLREAEEKLVELVSQIIHTYELQRFPRGEKVKGVDVLRYLMEVQGLKQKNLVPDVFETESVASDILNGNREFTLRHVRRLAERFHLSADVFIDQ